MREWGRQAALAWGLALALWGAMPEGAQAGPLRERLQAMQQARQAAKAAEAAGQSDLPAGTRVLRDQPYGPATAQRFDVYLPPQPVHDAPVILMVHGGGWSRGDKAVAGVVQNKATRWLPAGVVLVSVNYRMGPEAPPLEQARDVARALAVAQRAAPQWGASASTFVLMGHSAGAHLVALLNAQPSLATEQGAQPWRAVVSLDSGALDVPQIMARRHFGLYDAAFGDDPAQWRAASPWHVLSAGGAPLLVVCSTQRADACPQGRAYADKAQALGLRVELLPQDLSHGDINKQLGRPGAYTEAVEVFLRSVGGLH